MEEVSKDIKLTMTDGVVNSAIDIVMKFIVIAKTAKEYCTPGHRSGYGFRKLREFLKNREVEYENKRRTS